MPSWLSRIFNSGNQNKEPAYIPLAAKPIASQVERGPQGPEQGKPRRKVVTPPLILEESQKSSWSPELRIKACLDKGGKTCVFFIDRPVLEGLSAWFPTRQSASNSSLAESIFDVRGVESVLLHEFTITVVFSRDKKEPWEDLAKEIGRKIRAHLKSDSPVLSESFRASIPSEEEIRERVQQVIDQEINPGVAAHSGVITLLGVTGNTIRIHMGGGCQGCAASTVTLKEGIHKAFRQAVPQLGAILDETDHSAGTNPYYDEIPIGMRQYA